MSELETLAGELEATAARLRDEADGEEARALVAHCAALSTRLGALVERESRAAEADPGPEGEGQEALL